MEVIQLSPEIDLGHIGPPLESGRLPSVFYFALSAEESLNLDPYNQPALYLAEKGIRVFSINLPAHGPNLSALDAIKVWALEFSEGKDPLAPFFEKVIFSLNALIDKGLIVREKIGLMGLSRGGLIAGHIAGSFNVRASVCFAPMTELTFAKEFEEIKDLPLAQQYNLLNHGEALCKETLRFYIGNRDVRVGTGKCFALLEHLVDTAYYKGIRSAPIEMVIAPSIGHMGHGTSKETFEHGAHWLGKILGAIR